MAMQLVKARQLQTGAYYMLAWLDTSQVVNVDGQDRPDPRWLFDATWAARDPAAYPNESAYRQMIRAEFYALARAERNRRMTQAGGALPIEGEVIPET